MGPEQETDVGGFKTFCFLYSIRSACEMRFKRNWRYFFLVCLPAVSKNENAFPLAIATFLNWFGVRTDGNLYYLLKVRIGWVIASERVFGLLTDY